MVVRAAVFLLLLGACSNDEFNGQDAAEEKAPEEAAVVKDVVVEEAEADTVEAEAGPTGFCATQPPSILFCDDFDELAPVAQSWSVTSPATPPAGSLDFGTGFAGKGAFVKAPTGTNVFLTQQVQGKVLHGFVFEMQLSPPALNTAYVRVQAGSSTFSIATDLTAGNVTIQGDTGGAVQIGPPDSAWHAFDVSLSNGKADVKVDGKSVGNVPFASVSSLSSSFSIGVITSTLGGNVMIDNVMLH